VRVPLAHLLKPLGHLEKVFAIWAAWPMGPANNRCCSAQVGEHLSGEARIVGRCRVEERLNLLRVRGRIMARAELRVRVRIKARAELRVRVRVRVRVRLGLH